MKTLVVYYSRTGNARKVALLLADRLGADVSEVIDLKDRSGPLGYVIAGKDAMLKNLATIEPTTRDPAEYDMVVIGTPVWAFTVSCAIRTWMTRYAAKLPAVAFFCTLGGSGSEGTFEAMTELAGKGPKATLVVLDKDLKSGAFNEQVQQFTQRLTQP